LGGFEYSLLQGHRRLVWDLLRDTDAYYLNHHVILVDFTAIETVRDAYEAASLPKPSYVALGLYTLASVLPHHPHFNSYLRVYPFTRVARYAGIDIAYTLEKAGASGETILSLSVLKNCEVYSFGEFLKQFQGQKDATLEELGYHRTHRFFLAIPGFLRTLLFRILCKPFPGIMRRIAGTVGFTSVGKWGTDITTPLSPKTMTLSLGCIRRRPMERDGELKLVSSAYVTLTYDHRVADGRDCARFGAQIKEFLESEILEPALANLGVKSP